MKTFKLTTIMALVVVALFSVSCGKDKKKKNCNPYDFGCNGVYNPYQAGQYMNPDMFNTQQGINTSAYQALQNYLQGSDAAGGTRQISYRVDYTTNYSELDLGLFKVPYFSTSTKPSTVQSYTVTLEAGTRANFSNLQVLSYSPILSVGQNGNLIQVVVGGSSMASKKRYVIDTSLHGSINPRQLDDFNAGKSYVLISQ